MIQIRNRLPDLKQIHNSLNDISSDEIMEDEQEREVEYNLYSGAVGNLLKKYLIINESLKGIENNLVNMKSMVTAEHINNFNSKAFDQIRCDSIKLGNDIVKKFAKLESKLPEANDFTTLARMNRLLYYGFFQQYVLLWTKKEQFLTDYEQKLKKNLQNQSQILNCNLTDEDIETLIENKNTNLFMSNILQDAETERKTLQAIQDRFEDLKKLEKSITQVHNLFISLQTIVAEQGDAIQRIETHFNATHHYVEEATTHLKMVEQIKQNKCCKLTCCFLNC